MKTIELKSTTNNDQYTKYIYDNFDIQNDQETIEKINYDFSKLNTFEWNIGVVYGSSGCGKTTILKDFGEIKKADFDREKSLISNFDWLEPNEATKLLTSIGLSSVPTWLRPFHLLSNGEQYRAELAYKVGKAKEGEIILIDEYTSVVNRDVAKAMSYSLQKYLRRTNKKIIVASCHFDIFDWLLPDWTCSPQNGGSLEVRRGRRQERPKIELQVSRVESSTWDIFKKHHYLTESVNKSCKFFLFTWNDKPIAIIALGLQIGRGVGKAFRESRVVVLPDFQGLGIGSSISRFMASIAFDFGYKYFTKTTNPALGIQRNIDIVNWQATAFNGKIRKPTKAKNNKYTSLSLRPSFCHKYIGKKTEGYSNLLLPIAEMRNREQMELSL